MIMTWANWGYSEMLADLRASNRFAFVRFSDGDWNCIHGRKGAIGDEHTYRSDLGAALLASIRSEPGYHIGMMPSMLAPGRWWASDRTIAFVAMHPELSWCSSMILHNASIAGRLGEFFEAMRDMRKVLVSHAGMAGMAPWLGVSFEHIIIPAHQCWDHREDIEPRVIEAAKRPGIVMFACSMPAKVWIRKAWTAGGAASLVDVGSVFDPYISDRSRTYMQREEYQLAPPLFVA